MAFVAPLVRQRILKEGSHEAIIGTSAVYVGGSFQTWKHLGARLTGSDIYTDGEIPILHIIMEFPTRTGWQHGGSQEGGGRTEGTEEELIIKYIIFRKDEEGEYLYFPFLFTADISYFLK